MLATKFNSVYVSKNIFLRTCSITAINRSTTRLKTYHDVPGPSSLPIIGQLHHFFPGGVLSNTSDPTFWHQMHQQYGPIVRLKSMFTPPMLILMDGDSIAQVAHGENNMPIRPGVVTLEYYRKHYSKPRNNQSTGLATEHGERWKSFRNKVNPVLLAPKIVKLYKESLDEVAVDMVQRLRSLRDENDMLRTKFNEEINLWVLESTGIVALGTRIHCFNPEHRNQNAKQLIQLTHDVFQIASEMDLKPTLWKYYPTKSFKRAMKTYEKFEAATKYYVDMALENMKNSNKLDDTKSMLERLLDIDVYVAHVMACDMLSAGIDTISSTMTGILYLLATNPEKQQKLREILNTDEEKSYLKACINEGMRLFPAISTNLRKSSKEYNIMGYRIPKGTYILFCHAFLSRSEDQYPRNSEYIPERWTADQNDPLYHGRAHRFATLPFGFGFRSCVGRRIAELNMEIFLKRVIESFDIEWRGPPPNIHCATINYFTGPFGFVFKDV